MTKYVNLTETELVGGKELKMSEYRLLIDGALVAGAATMDVVNPATGKSFATAPRADRTQLDVAVAAAQRAWPAWAALDYAARAERLSA